MKKRNKNHSTITKKMTLLEIVEQDQSRIDVFKRYDAQAGTCLMCNHLFETLEDVCEKFNLDADKIIDDLLEASISSQT